ncbi:hypothetical protein HPB50_001866 [Hyalomma asiaticum]|uniref:Uncharacterized protein n=1 Tax=Hyalomma asiaticum TaxID=266040 RepID=A0ACB7SUC2_HYAAI|nr:hypothetical protein HPB50_001866 [Hyalomma asiaticum]
MAPTPPVAVPSVMKKRGQRGSYKTLTMAKKAEIIRQVEGGRPQSEVAREFSISKQTVSDYLKQRAKILEAAEKASAGTQENFRDGSHPQLEEALNMWLSATVARKIPASGDLLRQKAETLALRMGITGCKFSDGWLRNFKKSQSSGQAKPPKKSVRGGVWRLCQRCQCTTCVSGVSQLLLRLGLVRLVLCALALLRVPWRAEMAPTPPVAAPSGVKKRGQRGSYKTLTMAKKAEIIRQVEGGRPQSEVAREFLISKQTVSDYLKQKAKILEAAEKASADYVSADDGVAVCSAVSLDNIIEAVCSEPTDASDEEEMDDAGEASTSVPTYAEVLSYIDNIRRFACARDDVGDLLPDIAALERTLMQRGWTNVQKKITDFFRR